MHGHPAPGALFISVLGRMKQYVDKRCFIYQIHNAQWYYRQKVQQQLPELMTEDQIQHEGSDQAAAKYKY